MPLAAFLPVPMAEITVAAPETMSPAAYIPSILVLPFSSITIFPHLLSSKSESVDVRRGFELLPICFT